MEVKPSEDGLINVVAYVSYTRVMTKIIDGQEYMAQTSGTLTCPPPESKDFTPYNELTKEQVGGWLDELTGVNEIDNSLDSEIYQLSHPPLKTLPLPF